MAFPFSKFILTAGIWVLAYIASAQNPFFVKSSSADEFSMASLVCKNHLYVLSNEQPSAFIDSVTRADIYKINANGQAVDSVSLLIASRHPLLRQIRYNGGEVIAVLGIVTIADSSISYLIGIDTNMNVQQILPLNAFSPNGDAVFFDFIQYQNATEFLGYVQRPNGTLISSIGRMTNGLINLTENIPPYLISYQAKKSQNSDSTFYLTWGATGSTAGLIYDWNQNTYVDTVQLANFILTGGIGWNEKMNAIGTDINPLGRNPLINQFKFNSFQLARSRLFAPIYPNPNKQVSTTLTSLNAISSDEAFFCFTSGTSNAPPVNQKSWINIYKIDSLLNTQWQIAFGGDANYFLMNTSVAQDSSLYLVCTRYDWTTQNNERDLYIYKIDKNGSLLSAPEFGGLQPIEAVVYPNPFTNQIEVNFLNEDLRQANVVLTDISGRTVLRQNLEMGLTKEHTLNTQNLPAGVYVLTLSDAQGNVLQRQKVVKQ